MNFDIFCFCFSNSNKYPEIIERQLTKIEKSSIINNTFIIIII